MKNKLLLAALLALMAGCSKSEPETSPLLNAVNHSTYTVWYFWSPEPEEFAKRKTEEIKKLNAAYDDLEKSRTWFARFKRRLIDAL